jgi:penicillin-binding protein 2
MDNLAVKIRFAAFQLLVLVAFGAILFRLWDLQVISQAQYRESADRNRFRLAPIDAPRGIIYDRLGRILVRNVPSFAVSIVPGGLPRDEVERKAVLARVAELLDMPVTATLESEQVADAAVLLSGPQQSSIEEILESRAIGIYAPVRIASNVARQVAFIIEEEHLDLPGVIVEAEPLRSYTEGPLLAHILGYLGRISTEQLAAYTAKGYRPDDLIGLAGVEFSQEAVLSGVAGQKHIEVDAYERQVRVIASQPPEPGRSIVLTIDIELQRAVETALREGMRQAKSDVGAVVAMDPRTGEILAMVSLPSFDNNLFTGGISYADFAALNSDPRHPLVNHAVGGHYPPGSAFKIVPAVAALETGVVDRSTRVVCEGTLYLPNRFFPEDWTNAQPFYCWYLRGHGAINVVTAIAQSCDIYFYKVAGGYQEFQGMGVERLAEYAAMLGFGKPTGVELPAEAAGLLPSPQWKRLNYGESWFTGDTYNAAIGQGFVLASPLQLLNATAAVANRGKLYRPQLVYQILDDNGKPIHTLEPELIRELDVSPQNLDLVRQGMRQAVTNGTAYLLRLPEVDAAGKTGSAEYAAWDEEGNLIMDEHGYLPTHAWFTAFAPYDDPEIVLVVFLAGGGEGSQTAVPVASNILRHYFGIPEPTLTPTPGTAGAN